MADDVAPLTSREALLFEEVAGRPVLEALSHLTAGTLPASCCVAALLVAGRRNAGDVTVDDVLDSFPAFADLAATATGVLEQLLADGDVDDQEGGT